MLDQIIIIVTAMLGVAGLLVLGAVLRRLGIMRRSFDRTLLKLIIRGLMPALIFAVVTGNPNLRDPMSVITPPLVGFGSIVLGFAVAWLAMRIFGARLAITPPARRTFIFTVGVFNYGYIALPITALLFDAQTVSILFLFNVGVDLAFWTVGVLVMTGHFSRATLVRAINPPSIAIVIALIANWMEWSPHIPVQVTEWLYNIGKLSIPLGLILIGATASDHLHEAGLARSGGMLLLANLLRLGLLPALFLLTAWLLPCSIELKQVIIVQAAMPAGVFSIIMTRNYNGDTPTAMRIILTTNIICLLTAPLWLPVGMMLVGIR